VKEADHPPTPAYRKSRERDERRSRALAALEGDQVTEVPTPAHLERIDFDLRGVVRPRKALHRILGSPRGEGCNSALSMARRSSGIIGTCTPPRPTIVARARTRAPLRASIMPRNAGPVVGGPFLQMCSWRSHRPTQLNSTYRTRTRGRSSFLVCRCSGACRYLFPRVHEIKVRRCFPRPSVRPPPRTLPRPVPPHLATTAALAASRRCEKFLAVSCCGTFKSVGGSFIMLLGKLER
jgi:hypothetical protein